jgi:hypothetical protein
VFLSDDASLCACDQVCVFDLRVDADGQCKGLICRHGRCDGRSGREPGEYDKPWGVIVASDSVHVVVADSSNHRAQVLRLVVSEGGSVARLDFVRVIGGRQGSRKGQMMLPRGVAMREVNNRETVLLAEYLNHRVSEVGVLGCCVYCVYCCM